MRSTKHQTCVKMSEGCMAGGGGSFTFVTRIYAYFFPQSLNLNVGLGRVLSALLWGHSNAGSFMRCRMHAADINRTGNGGSLNVLQQISDASNCVVITYSTKLTYCRGNCMNFGQYLREWQMGRWRRTYCYSLHFTQEFQKGSGG